MASAGTWSGSRMWRPSSSRTWPSAMPPGPTSSVAMLPDSRKSLSGKYSEPGAWLSPPNSGDGAGMADPGVDDGVEHVDAEVDEHVGDGDDDDTALDRDVVPAEDAAVDVPADA